MREKYVVRYCSVHFPKNVYFVENDYIFEPTFLSNFSANCLFYNFQKAEFFVEKLFATQTSNLSPAFIVTMYEATVNETGDVTLGRLRETKVFLP